MQQPVTLVFDHAEALSNQECRDAIAELSVRLPSSAQLAVATRGQAPLPLAQLRSQGAVVEFGAADLAMREHEARALLEQAGVPVDDVDPAPLIANTEGWPVGLYLGALALNAGAGKPASVLEFGGDDRFVADYLHAELLTRLSPEMVTFLTRTSVLERMSGPLCDTLLGSTNSSEILRELEDSNLLLVPLDRRREWFRYHHLFRELLRAELEIREHDMVPDLYCAAAAWSDDQGWPEIALDYAQRGGDFEQVAALILCAELPAWSSGRVDKVLRWLDWFERNGQIAAFPEVGVRGALIFAMVGRPADADRWITAVESVPLVGTVADGSTLESVVAFLRAFLAREGVDRMRHDAAVALDGLNATSHWRPGMVQVEGLCQMLEGEPAGADSLFAMSIASELHFGKNPAAAMVLALRAIIAIERDDWSAASIFVDEARVVMSAAPVEDYWTSALPYAMCARVALHRGDIDDAREYVMRAARLRPILTYAVPVMSVLSLIELAQVYIGLADPGGATEVLRQARDILQRRPNLGNLPKRVAVMREQLETIKTEHLGSSSLTTAELRLVPLLQTHLTYPEIAERVNRSRHTVKTQALSIYQKLGVSSRAEAIERMREIGLLDA